jgi:DNA repair photolyase
MPATPTTVRSILTRTGGYLASIASHTLQPYKGCAFGKSLCGVGCYVQHAGHLTQGRPWGSFLEIRTNAADAYRQAYARERNWAQRALGRFVVFLSSATEPFPPQEDRERVTQGVLQAMCDLPPDGLILQTHSHRVAQCLDLLRELQARTDLRVHISIETDRERLPGLPRHASSVEDRFQAARILKGAGLNVVITVAPLLPIDRPDAFFARIAREASAVVLDHYVGGDGTPGGSRTLRTPLPAAMAAVDPRSLSPEYLREMARVALQHLPGRVGLHRDGFAGRWISEIPDSPTGPSNVNLE